MKQRKALFLIRLFGYLNQSVARFLNDGFKAFLVNIANAWIDRQNLLDPVQMMLRSNGINDVDLRFRNTVLTTLDTGAGTQKTLS